MEPAPIPENEEQRLASLHNLALLDTAPEERFDVITRTATRIFHVPISTLTLVDSKREWFKSCQGLPAREGDRAISFCGHALLSPDIMVVPDTKKDPRFADNPMVTGEPYLRFYAGVPVVSADGARVGVVCIKDTKPRKFSKDEEETLKGLAVWAEVEINSHNLSQALTEERRMRIDLKVQTEQLERLDKAQEETSAKEAAILASIADGCIAVNVNGEIILINQTAQKMLGYTTEESMGKKWYEILHRQDENGNLISPGQGAISAALSTTTTVDGITSSYYVRKDGTRFPVSRTVAPITLQGKVIGAVNTFRDITHEQEVDRAKSEFISIASHQMRTPLTGIQWVVERFTKKEKLTPKGKEYLDDIHTSSKKLTELVDLMLNLSRIEAGKVGVTPEPIEVVSFVKGYLQEVGMLSEKKGLKVVFEDHPAELTAKTDKNNLRNIVQNLISNAIEYTPEKGRVEIAIQKKADTFLMKVKDTGIGIPKAEQHQIFEKFARANNAKLYKTDGTGIGLYIASRAADLLGGKIWFESEENKGSTFYVELPLEFKPKEERKPVAS